MSPKLAANFTTQINHSELFRVSRQRAASRESKAAEDWDEMNSKRLDFDKDYTSDFMKGVQSKRPHQSGAGGEGHPATRHASLRYECSRTPDCKSLQSGFIIGRQTWDNLGRTLHFINRIQNKNISAALMQRRLLIELIGPSYSGSLRNSELMAKLEI